MYEDKILYVSRSQITIENTPANRISEAAFYEGLSESDDKKLVVGEWYLQDGTRIWITEYNTEKAVFILRARLANKGICIGEQNPYILQAEIAH